MKVRTKSERIAIREKSVSFVIMLIVCILFLLPFFYMIGTSFKSDMDLMLHPDRMFPSTWSEWTLKHYSGFIIRDGELDNMIYWMINSLWSTALSVFLVVATDLVIAYALVFMKWKGRIFFYGALMLWMLVPAGLIGMPTQLSLFAQIKNGLDLSDTARYMFTYSWLILPSGLGIFNLMLMRTFYLSIPKDIIDSAKSDGASHLTIFFKLIVPLARPTIMLLILFSFNASWNSLQWPQLLFGSEPTSWYTITVALATYTGGSAWGQMGVSMATSVFSLIPIMIIFFITQNRMIDGMVTTGVKG